MDISIIIPTYNNADLLKNTLGSLRNLDVDGDILWEVIIVNNNCNDNTDEVVKYYQNLLPVKLYHQKQQGTSVAKNTGITNSTGRLIVFTDDDVKPEPNWLAAYWKGFCESPEGCFWGGPVVSDFESEQPSAKLMQYAPPSVVGLDFGHQRKVIEQEKYFIGANWACPRKALDEVGYFDVNMGLVASDKLVKVGEETDLMSRLRRKGLIGFYLPEAKNHHFVPAIKTTLKHIASREEAHAYYVAMKEFADNNLQRVPMWIYRNVFESWFNWQLIKITGKDCIDEYICHKRTLGLFRAASDSRNI